MTEEITFDEAAGALRDYLNTHNRDALLRMARNLAGALWASEAQATAVHAAGLDLLVTGGGRQETARVSFSHEAAGPGELRWLTIELADRADPPDGLARVATARVETEKAARYLKALCNHFDRKGVAIYDDNAGRVRFPFGECELVAEESALLLRVTADSDGRFQRVRHVVADHLIRFANKEALVVNWAVMENVAPTV